MAHLHGREEEEDYWWLPDVNSLEQKKGNEIITGFPLFRVRSAVLSMECMCALKLTTELCYSWNDTFMESVSVCDKNIKDNSHNL